MGWPQHSTGNLLPQGATALAANPAADLALQAGSWDIQLTDMIAFHTSVKDTAGNDQFSAACTFENPTFDHEKVMFTSEYKSKQSLQAAYNNADRNSLLLRQEAGSLCLLDSAKAKASIIIMQHVKGIGNDDGSCLM